MGDKSPKSKERGRKQKVAATARDVAQAKSKQDGNSQSTKPATPLAPKRKN
jgi:hypothetical protein